MLFAWSGQGGPFQQLRQEMNKLFDSAFLGRPVLANVFDRRTFPRVNLRETAEALVVECEVPGVGKDDLDIGIEGGVLTVRGERKAPEERGSEQFVRRERSFGPFERSVELPAKVEVDQVKASYANGILEITLPKSPESKPRKIEVSIG